MSLNESESAVVGGLDDVLERRAVDLFSDPVLVTIRGYNDGLAFVVFFEVLFGSRREWEGILVMTSSWRPGAMLVLVCLRLSLSMSSGFWVIMKRPSLSL